MKKPLFILPMVVLLILMFSCTALAASKDVRGVWVSTVYSLDYPNSPTASSEALKSQADTILNECEAMGMNAVFLQVRPAGDSLYPSSIYPWSKYLTGTQGKAPDNGFDPLDYWITAAHNRGIELHAWINPYRAAVDKKSFQELSENHPGKRNPDWIFESGGKYYFNPGIPAVRKLVVDGVNEIMNRYNVDGIHLDDYFYPGSGGNYDDNTFQEYSRGITNKAAWRRGNNDLLIQELRSTTKAKGKIFGVSPAGVWANKSTMSQGSNTRGNESYVESSADTRKWVKENWLDYICPQIYWPIGYEIADYEILAKWWSDVVSGTGVDLYIGMADYRYLNTDSSKWTDINIIQSQLSLNETLPLVQGEVHFRYESLVSDSRLKDLYTKVYKNQENVFPMLPGPTAPHTPYVQGEKGKFRPDDGLTRAEFSVIFSKLIVDSNGNPLFQSGKTYRHSFKDVAVSSWYSNVIGFMKEQGVVSGYPNGTFLPNAKISRAECAVMISRFFEVNRGYPSHFNDVPPNHWAKPAIANCEKKGYVSGYEDGDFRPYNTIRRGEVVSMVNRILGRIPDKAFFQANPGVNIFSDISTAHWAYYHILEASYHHNSH